MIDTKQAAAALSDITVLTLIGYFFLGEAALLLWMAAVNGGGLILSGLWMRWN